MINFQLLKAKKRINVDELFNNKSLFESQEARDRIEVVSDLGVSPTGGSKPVH